ncbi:MAG TPA: DEAD/DEAH box helicase family protein, partial [Candidatus Methanomethylicus sp.]|nr:DEAD/DEAH box helicase family protein [Candidatus Methanomethylicus sp.]
MAERDGAWNDYLRFLEGSPYSLQLMTSNLSPSGPIRERGTVTVERMGYRLWPFQEKILKRMGKDTLVVGLPTGLGKTYLAGAFIAEESKRPGCRVLFLTPSVPLGVQQTLFARRMLGLSDAYFISGSMPPERRRGLGVWKAGFAVTTPQTFYNDALERYSRHIEAAKGCEDPVGELATRLRGAGFAFPYSLVVADECHGYIGETDGHAILLAAKASGAKILALSATPQLHAPRRLRELKRIFDRVEAISVEEPEIKAQMPERLIVMTRVAAPPKLLAIYKQLGEVIKRYQVKAARVYGAAHARGYCTKHGLCVCLIALKVMRSRIVEDGASSVSEYGTWKVSELKVPLRELGGRS